MDTWIYMLATMFLYLQTTQRNEQTQPHVHQKSLKCLCLCIISGRKDMAFPQQNDGVGFNGYCIWYGGGSLGWCVTEWKWYYPALSYPSIYSLSMQAQEFLWTAPLLLLCIFRYSRRRRRS